MFPGTARFEVRRRLGQGGMGVVYEAFDRRHGTRVALKTLRDMSPEALLRLKQEFRELQDLQHPNLVSLGELIEEQGMWFLTMELVEGESFLSYVRPQGAGQPAAGGTPTGGSPSAGTTPLAASAGTAPSAASAGTAPSAASAGTAASASSEGADTLPADEEAATADPAAAPPRRRRLGQLDEQRLRQALLQLARGLCALHAGHKVHRDIKPSNVRVASDGRLVLLDFGLVTTVARGTHATDAAVVGTVDYMAPEQAAGGRVGPAADWYAVGAMLYEALVGRPPFEGAGLKVLMDKQRLTPPAPKTLVATVPEDLDTLCMELLRIEPRERPAGEEVRERLGGEAAFERSSAASVSQSLHAPGFVGRQAELELLRQAFEETRQGSAATVLVEGESGVGKSALVRHFSREIAKTGEVVVLTGRCYEHESVPYKGFDGVIDSLSRYLARLDERDAAALLPRHAGLLGRVFPVLRRVNVVADAPVARRSEQIEPQEQRQRLFGSVREILARIADRQQVVIVIDDLQWSEADTRALLGEILRSPDEPTLLLLATARSSGEPETERPPFLAGLPPSTHRLCLGRLNPEEARELAATVLRGVAGDHVTSAAAIAEEAQGHPLFIHELARHVSLEGQPTTALRLDETLWSRVQALPEDARSILELVAVAGVPLAQGTVREAAALAPTEVTRALSVLRVGHLVRVAGSRATDGVEPYHDRVRESVLGHLAAAARRDTHRRLARALEREGADAQLLAAHWRGAGEDERAADYALRAGSEADRAFAFEVAARLYRMALDLYSPDGSVDRELQVRLADALANAGRGVEAAEVYLQAAEGAQTAQVLDLQRRAAEQYLRTGHIEEGLSRIRVLLERVGLSLPRSPLRALAWLLWSRARIRLRGLGYRARDESQLSPAELARFDTCWSLAMGVAVVDTVQATAFQEQGVLWALAAGEPRRLSLALSIAAVNRAIEGAPTQRAVRRLHEAARKVATRANDPVSTAWVNITEYFRDYYLGEWRQCLENTHRAGELLRNGCRGVAYEMASTRLWRVWALHYLGELAELERSVSRYLRDAEDRGDLYSATNLCTGPASLAWIIRDQAEESRRRAREALGRWSRRGYHVQHWLGLASEVMAALYLGEADTAWHHVTQQWAGLRRSQLLRVQVVRIEARVYRARAALALAAAGDARRPQLLREAQRQARRVLRERRPWATPLAELILAGVAACRRQPDEARATLARAEAGFQRSDMACHEAVARYRLGQLTGGDEGRELQATAAAWLRAERVMRPGRLVVMMAPGFPG